MIKGIRFGNKKGVRTTFHAVRLVQLYLFCLVGVLSAGPALSAAVQPVANKNLSDQESYTASDRALSTGASDKPEELASVVETSKADRSGEVYQLTPIPNPSIGVAIIGGLALFFWIQRFRNSSV